MISKSRSSPTPDALNPGSCCCLSVSLRPYWLLFNATFIPTDVTWPAFFSSVMAGSSSSSQSQVCSRRCWCCHEKMIYNTVWVYVMFGEGLCKKGLRAPVHAVVKFGHAKGFSRPKHVHFRHEGLTLQEYDSVFCSGKDGSVGLGLGDCSVSPPSRLRFGSTTCCFFSLRLGAFLNKSVCVCAN